MAQRIHDEHPEWVFLYQYANAANPKAHYEGTGPEIWRDCPEVTHFVAGLGTSGTLLGVGRFLKERNPAVEVWAVEPPAGEMVDGLRNLDDGYIPPIFTDLGGRRAARPQDHGGPPAVGGMDPAPGRGGRVRGDLVGRGHGRGGQVRAGHRVRGDRGGVGRRRLEVPVDRRRGPTTSTRSSSGPSAPSTSDRSGPRRSDFSAPVDAAYFLALLRSATAESGSRTRKLKLSSR